MSKFEKYLDDTQVQGIFQKLLHMLLSRQELPYNPFPGFYGRLRGHQERFHFAKESKKKILSHLKNPLKETNLQSLYTIQNYNNVWGLSSILKVVNPHGIDKYRWLMQDVRPRHDQLPSLEGYSNQVMLALIGPSVFDGSFFSSTYTVHLRLEYLVTGHDVTQGISIFVNSLMKDVDDLYISEHHYLLRVSIPTANATNPEIWANEYWEPDKIQAEKETFLQKVCDAVIGNKYVFVECIFLLDPGYPSYVRGEKQYGFNFIKVVDDMREDGLSSFCEYPMATLHEGVFFDRAHAEAYLSLFQTQIEDFETADTFEAGAGAPPQSPGLASLGQGSQAPPNNLSHAATAHSTNFRLSTTQEHNVNNVQQHVHDRLKHVKPRRVRIDGFRFGDKNSTGPFAWQITTPIKANYQRKIAGHWQNVELFEIIYSIIILVLMDRNAFDDDILVECYRLLHATAGSVHSLMEQNKGLRSILQVLSNTADYSVIKTLLQEYQGAVKKLFQNTLVERSHDQVIIGRCICDKVETMIQSPDMEFASGTHLHLVHRGLKSVNLYLLPLLMELAEDSLSLCPETSSLITKMAETFVEENPRPVTRYKKSTLALKASEPEEADQFISHGIEDENIKKHETFVLNVTTCIAKDTSPQIIVKENILMKYILDCHFDEMWSGYLLDLAGGDLFPPNPFPRLLTIIRQYTMKMDLFFEKSVTITEKMFNLEVKLEDPENFVYYVPGLEAHGTLTSLMLLDTGTYAILSQIFKRFQQKSYIQKKGAYRVGICLALSGSSIWYGHMQPYLNEIELHEHYYVQGPSGCSVEAIQLCALIVYNHMVDMIAKYDCFVMGVYFGQTLPDQWTCEDILAKKQGFLSEFVHMCTLKQPIYAKAYVLLDGWHYVTLKKHFQLHFLVEGCRPEIFYPGNPASFYQSVFLSKDRAAFHYQNYGPPLGGDPMSIANVKAVTSEIEKTMCELQAQNDWLNFYRNLLVRDLISQDQSKIADCWRMFHSMAGQVEYVVVMMEVLQDLVLTWLGNDKSQQESRHSSKDNKHKDIAEQKILTKMVMAVYQKLIYICEARVTMITKTITEYMEAKLMSALEFDPDTGKPSLAIEDQTIFKLEEMKSMMKMFQDTLSWDVHSIFQNFTLTYKAQKLLSSQIEKQVTKKSSKPLTFIGQNRGYTMQNVYLSQPDIYHHSSRPTSVASNILNDPDFYKQKPRNMLNSLQ